MVMELLEGRSLDHIIAGVPLGVDSILEIGIQIADAMNAAHAKGIVQSVPAKVFLALLLSSSGKQCGPSRAVSPDGVQLALTKSEPIMPGSEARVNAEEGGRPAPSPLVSTATRDSHGSCVRRNAGCATKPRPGRT